MAVRKDEAISLERTESLSSWQRWACGPPLPLLCLCALVGLCCLSVQLRRVPGIDSSALQGDGPDDRKADSDADSRSRSKIARRSLLALTKLGHSTRLGAARSGTGPHVPRHFPNDTSPRGRAGHGIKKGENLARPSRALLFRTRRHQAPGMQVFTLIQKPY
jgi:hypothetical protein